MSVPVIVAAVAGASFAVTLIVLMVRGSYQLGKLVNKVENHDAKIDTLEAKFDAKFDTLITAVSDLRAEVSELRAEIQQTNKILTGLANHTHPQDMDGRTYFTVPS